MSVQARQANAVIPFYREGDGRMKDAETFLQDGGRATALAQYTVVAQTAANRKWVPLTSVDPTLTKGKMVCGAAGTAEAGFQAVSDGEFTLSVDGVSMDITALDFTGIEAPTRTGATAVCGALGANLGAFQAITDGGFSITVDGVALDIIGLNFTTITALDELADTINSVALGRVIATYDATGTILSLMSAKRGDTSTITALGSPSVGTDISGAGHLNGGAATLVQGAGDDGTDRNLGDVINEAAAGRFYCLYDGAAVSFFSPTVGVQSTVTVLTDTAGSGTDISGAGFLNGLTAVGTATAGAGEDGTTLPTGIFVGTAITAAALVAGDVTGQMVLVGGNVVVDKDQVVLENSLALTDVVVSRAQTIESALQERGLYLIDTRDISA